MDEGNSQQGEDTSLKLLTFDKDALLASFKEIAFEKNINVTGNDIEVLSVRKSERIAYNASDNTMIYAYKQMRSTAVFFFVLPIFLILTYLCQLYIWTASDIHRDAGPLGMGLFLSFCAYLIIFYEKIIYVSSSEIKIKLQFFPFFYTRNIKISDLDKIYFFKSYESSKNGYSEAACIYFGNNKQHFYDKLTKNVYKSSAPFGSDNVIRTLFFNEFLVSAIASITKRPIDNEVDSYKIMGKFLLAILWAVVGVMLVIALFAGMASS